MADPRFFNRAGPFRAAELAQLIGAQIAAGGDGDLEIRDVAPLDRASAGDVSFLDNRKYVDAFTRSTAAACIVHERFADQAPAGMVLLLSTTPHKTYALAAAALYPTPLPVPGVAPGAVIDPTAVIGDGCRIGPGVVIGPAAVLGARCDVDANAVIGRAVRIGNDTVIGANASLSHCDVGDRTLIHPGVRIGQRGFGFAVDPTGHVMVPQLGRVLVGDDVEIGANTAVDRGSGPDTVIGDGTMIDNLVQIGHNVQIGKGCIIIGQAGIAGSTVLEDHVIVAAQAGIAGHLTIGKGAQIAAKSGLMRDVEPGAKVAGMPAVTLPQFLRQNAVLGKLVKKKGG